MGVLDTTPGGDVLVTTMAPADQAVAIPYKILLVVVYSALFVYIVTQMVLTLRGKNKKQSFNFGFLLICILWVGVRLAYFVHFLTDDPDPSPFWDLANTAAVDIQFAALTFLMLFYVRMMLRMRWQAWRRRLSVLVFVINALFDAFSVAVFILQQLYTSVFPQAPAPSPMPHHYAQQAGAVDRDWSFVYGDDDARALAADAPAPAPAPNDEGFSNALEDVFVFFCGFMFFVLSVSMLVFGVRLCQLHDSDLSMNAKEIAGVTITLAVIFGSRSVFDFLNTFDAAPIYFPACGDREDFSLLVFALFLWWECVPIVVLLVTLAKSMNREQAVFGKRSTFEPQFGLFAEMEKEQQAYAGGGGGRAGGGSRGLGGGGNDDDDDRDEALLRGVDSDLLSPPSDMESVGAGIAAGGSAGGVGSVGSDSSTRLLGSSQNPGSLRASLPRPGYGTVQDNYMGGGGLR